MSSLQNRRQHITGDALHPAAAPDPDEIAAATRRAHALRGQAFRAAAAAIARFLVPSSTGIRRHPPVDRRHFPDAPSLRR